MARKILAWIVLALCVLTATVRAQGGPFGAQIENFWRLIAAGGRTFTSISVSGGTIAGTTITGATITGGTITGTAITSTSMLLGNGTVGAPSLAFTSETGMGWYRAALGQMAFVNDQYSSTVPMLVLRSGALEFSSVASFSWSATTDATGGSDISFRRSAAKTLTIDTDGAGGALTNVNVQGPLTSSAALIAGTSVNANANSGFTLVGSAAIFATASKLVQVADSGGTTGSEWNGGTPTLGACTGGSMTSGSHNIAGEVTGNTSGSCVINFGTPNFTNAPFCFVNDETTLTAVRISARSNSSITVTGAVSADAFQFFCIGRIGT